MKEKTDQAPLKAAAWRTSIGIRLLKLILLGLVLAMSLLDHGLAENLDYGTGGSWPGPASPQTQMWSEVDYDPKLTDPFFDSDEWSYPDYDLKGTPLDKRPRELPRLKHTAKCFSTSFLEKEHLVKFCEARLLDVNMIDLLIHEDNAAFFEKLRVQMKNGMFTCQYWGLCDVPPHKGFIWTTKRQKLTLDKKVYRKGDVIKGRIDFECVQKINEPLLVEKFGKDPKTIKVYGVFKTIVE